MPQKFFFNLLFEAVEANDVELFISETHGVLQNDRESNVICRLTREDFEMDREVFKEGFLNSENLLRNLLRNTECWVDFNSK